MTDFYSPLPSYDLVRAAEMLTRSGVTCTGKDLIQLWNEGILEICFSLPDYIACEHIDFPGYGHSSLMAISAATFNLFWQKQKYHYDFPPDSYASFSTKEYNSDSSYQDKRFWIPCSFDYSPDDDNGSRLYSSAFDNFGLEALRIPGAELQKAWQLLKPKSPDKLEDVATKGVKAGVDSAKTVNYLAKALKAFILIHYSADEAENLRKHLEDPTSEIRKDFANKGIKAPGGKALAGHLKNILLEIVPALENVDVERDAGEK